MSSDRGQSVSGVRTWFITGASRGCGALIAVQALAARDAVVGERDPLTRR